MSTHSYTASSLAADMNDKEDCKNHFSPSYIIYGKILKYLQDPADNLFHNSNPVPLRAEFLPWSNILRITLTIEQNLIFGGFEL